MQDIKLFVCCHEPALVPDHPLLRPVQVGAALAEQRIPGFAADDRGDNISAQNESYCELTAQYWAWKNVNADYYGFFHYRRYLYPDPGVRIPYMVARRPEPVFLQRLGYGGFADLIEKYDLIAPMGENMHIPVREHYANAPHEHSKDLALIEQIVREHCPEMAADMERYFSGTVCYFGNIYIMRREVFADYCAWLFPLLAEFDARADTRSYDRQERRVDGYLGERLFGVYLTHHRAGLKTLELPRVNFYGDGAPYLERKVLNALLPPSSVRRSRVKKVWREMPWRR